MDSVRSAFSFWTIGRCPHGPVRFVSQEPVCVFPSFDNISGHASSESKVTKLVPCLSTTRGCARWVAVRKCTAIESTTRKEYSQQRFPLKSFALNFVELGIFRVLLGGFKKTKVPSAPRSISWTLITTPCPLINFAHDTATFCNFPEHIFLTREQRIYRIIKSLVYAFHRQSFQKQNAPSS
ncbi:hypothetical protein BS50DRAFT_305412 [Corynespora cassiicola Philippines]|uniref:Uncharacterized protein n=1 Tax=Corynespora cassiicola Philippines TaxID=1448308 RepID=A0A2T2NYE9_CORCC|nr:hypothetical protein BS50DRAFT_305412 [Corynespora cassiicola Philippines]